jgi:hypothetical protein
MHKSRLFGILGLFAFMAAAQDPTGVLLAQNASELQYKVLSPWAEVDAVPLKGLSPRLDNLAGKKIGLFVNYKRAARPIALSLEKRLKSMFPDSQISFFYSLEWNVLETETKNRDKFSTWAKGVDAVIESVGD